MTRNELQSLLNNLRDRHVAVLGDYCLDIYWFIDPAASELSLETGLPTRPVAGQRYSLGGAGNVLNNMAALGCRNLYALGAIGDDPWGRETLSLLRGIRVNTDGMLTQTRQWATLAYTKPYVQDAEENRIDFGNLNALPDAGADRLLEALEGVLPRLDLIVVNEQVKQGIHTPHLRRRLAELMRRYSRKMFIVDSRHYSDAYPEAFLKVNDHEAARLTGIQRPPAALILRSEAEAAANALFEKRGQPVFVTRQGRGCLVRDAAGMHEIPGIQIMGQIDTVGAGDSMLAGIALALAAGAEPEQAAMLGNFTAGVTIQKLRQTGTATPEEIMAIGADPDYNYLPDLAEDTRQARFIPETEFEIVTDIPAGLRVARAIFDHDGTLSTLRQGWEEIMEPMMVRTILGPRFQTADESLYHQVLRRVREYIDKSTGVQTLVQMRALADMVREFGCVPAPEILDEFGYKKIYNDALMDMVRRRLAKLERGELTRDDFVIKNAVLLLERLRRAGVVMCLASGTDEADVAAEARALGYAELFTGGIYGSVGSIAKEAKRIVLDRILKDIGREGIAGLVTFGDGPVEIRETRKHGGFAVGVASDEVRRFGLNGAKRARLVRAGADMIVPDFSQLEALLRLLHIQPA